nr:acyl carrier protein 2, mitochondrial-like [Tanacetum cinerariifolium]
MAAARNTLLKYLRVTVTRPSSSAQNPSRLIASNLFRRHFSTEEVRGSFLDKSEVTDRVVTCVKNFQKVDPSK